MKLLDVTFVICMVWVLILFTSCGKVVKEENDFVKECRLKYKTDHLIYLCIKGMILDDNSKM